MSVLIGWYENQKQTTTAGQPTNETKATDE